MISPAHPQELTVIIGGRDARQTDLTWFAVSVGFRSEYRVCEALTEAGFERYCPSERKLVTHGRKRAPKDYPLFPGYVFVGMEPIAHGPFGAEFPFDAVEMIEDVSGFVAFGGRPRPIAYDAVAPKAPRPGSPGFHRAPVVRRSLSEIRAMEESGAFDYTINAKVAASNIRKARKTLRGLQGLAEHPLAARSAA